MVVKQFLLPTPYKYKAAFQTTVYNYTKHTKIFNIKYLTNSIQFIQTELSRFNVEQLSSLMTSLSSKKIIIS